MINEFNTMLPLYTSEEMLTYFSFYINALDVYKKYNCKTQNFRSK